MKRGRLNIARRAERGFTMIEIALCIAIIGFALVAIIGILPAGMNVQKDNREDTLISQDGTYFIEAIRNGAQGLDELTNFVDAIELTDGTKYTFGSGYTTGREIVGLLSTPPARPDGIGNKAIVRAISGTAAEKGNTADAKDFAFKYQLEVLVDDFRAYDRVPENQALAGRLRELRIVFRWPVLPSGKMGKTSNRQVFRTLASGELIQDPQDNRLQFFRQ